MDGGTKDLVDEGRAVGKQVLFVDELYKQYLSIVYYTVIINTFIWSLLFFNLFNQFYLYMDGRGAFDFKPITDETLEFGS